MKTIFLGRLFSFFLFILSAGGAGAGPSTWFDQSHRVFFPADQQKQVTLAREFSVFWWNFVVVDIPHGNDHTFAELQKLCQDFARKVTVGTRRISCALEFKADSPFLSDWVGDVVLRRPFPGTSAFQKSARENLAKASLPMGAGFVRILRTDPTSSLDDLRERSRKRLVLRFQQEQGIFFDPETSRAAFAIQFDFPPSQTEAFSLLLNEVQNFCQPEGKAQEAMVCRNPRMIGPHASTFENETQIKDDLKSVSVVGSVLLLGFMLLLILTRRQRLLLLVPPLVFSMASAAGLTIFCFGSIHGLTLSFGPGIIGLAMDYALHAAFSYGPQRSIWKANLFGVFTTLSVLVIVMFSEIPLLRQLMFFSASGLVIGFGLFYLLHTLFPEGFRAQPFVIQPVKSNVLTGLAMALSFVGITGLFYLQPRLEMKQMNFESAQTTDLQRWFYRGLQAPLLQFRSTPEVLNSAHEELRWAQAEHLMVENVAAFLPNLDVQATNLQSWTQALCGKKILTTDETDFFEPFLSRLPCSTPLLRDLTSGVPAYLYDLTASQQWVSLWTPRNEDEKRQIQKQFPEAISLLEMVSVFPKLFLKELAWMVPAALLLSFLLLLLYFRNPFLSFVALIPFFSGVGFYWALAMINGWQVTLMSLVGLIMVFGLSLDYGIFVTDLIVDQKKETHGLWTSLSFNSISTTLGFVPLIFCSHPVLRQLGESLVFGSMGTYLGAVWGILPFWNYSSGFFRKKVSRA